MTNHGGIEKCGHCADGWVWNPTVDGNVEECRFCGGSGIAGYKGFINLVGPCDEVIGEFLFEGEVVPVTCDGTEFDPWDENPSYGVCRACGQCCAHNLRERVL